MNNDLEMCHVIITNDIDAADSLTYGLQNDKVQRFFFHYSKYKTS